MGRAIAHGARCPIDRCGRQWLKYATYSANTICRCPDFLKSENVTDPFPLAKWTKAEITTVIGPKQSFQVQGCNVPIGTINEAKNGLRDVFYVLEAKYIDGFNLKTIRLTQVSRIFRFDQYGGGALWFIGPHNCSDADCPSER